MPPLSFGERFEDVYEVILILDDREQFATQGLVTSAYSFVSCRAQTLAKQIEGISFLFQISFCIFACLLSHGICIKQGIFLFAY